MKARASKREVDGILLLDKPEGITSNTALQRVKRLYQATRAGHTGSLDPIATGLLPICLGQATKLSGLLLDADKSYRVTARLGVKTSTGDREGPEVARSDPSGVRAEHVQRALSPLTGPQRQVPPMYSALKHQGKRLYELAREGQEVERAPRDIVIRELHLVAFEGTDFTLDVSCSKGTYVRTLIEDLCASLGQVGHVIALRRTGAAPFWAPRMVTTEALEAAAGSGTQALDALLLPVVAGAQALPKVQVDDDRAFYLARGQAVRISPLPEGEVIAVLNAAGRLLGLGRRDPDGMLAPSRWMT